MGRDGDGVRAVSASSIEITFTYRGQRCRERIKLQPTSANLKRAARHRAAVLDAIERGTFDYAVTFPSSPRAARFASQPGDIVQLGTYLERWLQRRQQVLKASTWDGYRKAVRNRLTPALGHLRLSEFRRRHAREWADTLDSSLKTINNDLSTLRAALQDASDDELIDGNPLYGWRYKRNEPPKPKDDAIDPFDADERRRILAALPAAGADMVQFWLWTGLRTSELIALDWDDIDMKKGKARIWKAVTECGRGKAETTKTAAGRRDIDLLPPALEALKRQKARTYLAGGRVWTNPKTGADWTGDRQIRKGMWKPALRKAGIRYRYPYQCRHSFASTMLQAGENVMWVARMLGHTDWTFTARIYSRWMPSHAQGAGAKALEMMGETRRPGESMG